MKKFRPVLYIWKRTKSGDKLLFAAPASRIYGSVLRLMESHRPDNLYSGLAFEAEPPKEAAKILGAASRFTLQGGQKIVFEMVIEPVAEFEDAPA